jgi:hypothetical protein
VDDEPGRVPPGGSLGRDEIEAAAHVSLAGIDPIRFLTTTDPLERQLMIEITERAHELHAQLREDQAIRIANAVAKIFGD